MADFGTYINPGTINTTGVAHVAANVGNAGGNTPVDNAGGNTPVDNGGTIDATTPPPTPPPEEGDDWGRWLGFTVALSIAAVVVSVTLTPVVATVVAVLALVAAAVTVVKAVERAAANMADALGLSATGARADPVKRAAYIARWTSIAWSIILLLLVGLYALYRYLRQGRIKS